MLKLALRNLLDKKIRFALTDSLRSTFGDLAQDIAGETDLTVRAAQEIGLAAFRAGRHLQLRLARHQH